MSTPWGRADYAKDLCEGIGSVSTPGHGGIKLNRQRNAAIPKPLRREGGWYEEDCDWAIPFFFFNADLRAVDARGVDSAESTLKEWMPHEFTAATGREVNLEESHVLREEVFYEKHRDDYITIAAWGDWQGGVPQGMVGVCAIKGGHSRTGLAKDRGPEKYFLVPEAEYDKRDIAFVIDLTRHQEVDDFSLLGAK